MADAAPRAILIPLIVASALVMQEIDASVMATAVPAISQALQANPLQLNLAITSYLITLAVFIPLSGWMADRFGARTVFQAAIIVFASGSILCGLSESLLQLVAARILEGMGGAMMVPVGRLIILRAASKAQLVSAMIWFTTPSLIGPVLGPPLGGLIVTYASWRWIFFINVPIAVLGIVLTSLYIKNSRESNVTPLDFVGLWQMGLALVGLMFGFAALSQGILSIQLIAALLIGGALCLGLYARHARRIPNPLVDLQLLKIPTFHAAMLGGGIFRIGAGAMPFILPLMLQLGFGLSALNAGLLTFASAFGALLMRLTGQPIMRRFGFKRLLVGNAIICAGFLLTNAFFQPDTPHLLILALLFVGGYFRSLEFTSISTLAYADVTSAQFSRASTLASTVQQIGQSLGVGFGALLLHLTLLWRGTAALGAQDFWPAFVCSALLTGSSALLFLRLPTNAGAELSGRSPPRKK